MGLASIENLWQPLVFSPKCHRSGGNMNMTGKTAALTFAILAALYAGSVSAFHCGTKIADVGDTEFEINQKCGQPIESRFVVVNPWGVVKRSIYDLGQGQFYQTVIFKDDKAVNIESGPRK
jgi:hypothetical protein